MTSRSDQIMCTRADRRNQVHYVVLALDHEDEGPLLDITHERPPNDTTDVLVDETIPEVGRWAYWGGGTYQAVVRARITYKGQHYAYLLQDTRGYPWVFVETLTLVPIPPEVP